MLREAARASLRLLSDEADEYVTDLPKRRVVVEADVEATLRPDLDVAVVKVDRPISRKGISLIRVDGANAEAAVSAAIEMIDSADFGDLDAELYIGDVEEFALVSYSPQETSFLLELL